MLKLAAYAKINLTLEVIRKRDDGYHDITSVMQTISLADTISFHSSDEIKFTCCDESIAYPEFIEEAVLGAIHIMKNATGCKKGALIQVETVDIPRAAGLGSSAGIPTAVLQGLNHLWGLSLSRKELCHLAGHIGSDAPFFICGGTALIEGRGEIVTPLPILPDIRLVLLNPQIDPILGKTSKLYGRLSSSQFTNGDATLALVQSIRRGEALQSSMLYNAFEGVAFDFFPGLTVYKQAFREAGAGRVHLAGAGPALFTLASNEAEGLAIVDSLKHNGLDAQLHRSITPYNFDSQ